MEVSLSTKLKPNRRCCGSGVGSGVSINPAALNSANFFPRLSAWGSAFRLHIIPQKKVRDLSLACVLVGPRCLPSPPGLLLTASRSHTFVLYKIGCLPRAGSRQLIPLFYVSYPRLRAKLQILHRLSGVFAALLPAAPDFKAHRPGMC